MQAGQGPVGPVAHGPRTTWQNIGLAKLQSLAKYHQIPSGVGNSSGDANFSAVRRPASGRPGSHQEPRDPWQNIGRAKLKRLAMYHQILSGFGNSIGDVNVLICVEPGLLVCGRGRCRCRGRGRGTGRAPPNFLQENHQNH